MSNFRLADMNHGAFGDSYATLEEAEKALAEEIAAWHVEDEKLSVDELGGISLDEKKAQTSSFLLIVDSEGTEV